MLHKILITNNYSSSNRGDAAILDGLIKLIENNFENLEITVLSSTPEDSKKYHSVNFYESLLNSGKVKRSNIHVYFLYMIYLVVWAFLYRYLKIELPKFSKTTQIDLYKNSDLIISVGGGYLNDFYRPGIITRLFEFWFAKLLKKKVVLWAHSIGPFEIKIYRLSAKYFLNKVDLIATRDKKSVEELEKLGVNKPKIIQTYDSAFALSGTIESDNGLNSFLPKERFISISVRYWSYYKDKEEVYRNYVNQIAKLCDWFIHEGFKVIFVSTSPGEHHIGDYDVAIEIKKKIKLKENVTIISETGYNLKDLVGLYERSYLNIGTRMHSTILSALVGTPSLAISYEFKSKELFALFDMNQFVLDQEDFSFLKLKERVINLIEVREEVSNKLNKKVRYFSEKTNEDFSREIGRLVRL